MTEIKRIPLHHIHESLGAKIIPFAGYDMPVRYSSDIEEHMAVRESVGLFDVSHMGEFTVKGPAALELIQKVSANDASVLSTGKVQYSYLPNETGGVVDDLLVYCLGKDDYLLVVNASNIDKDWAHIQKYMTHNVVMENRSEHTSLFALQGPKAIEVLQPLTDIKLADMDYYTSAIGTVAGIEHVLVSATGYTGAGGYELYVANEHAEALWNALMNAGETFGIKPIGLGARDTLRLEMGYCLYGNDLNDSISPLEAGLGWVTKFTKDFVNSAALKEQKETGIHKKLVGLEMIDRGIPRSHYTICTADGTEIGEVTSGTQSPSLKKGIALGYVLKPYAKVGQDVYIKVREKLLLANVVKTPFVKPGV